MIRQKCFRFETMAWLVMSLIGALQIGCDLNGNTPSSVVAGPHGSERLKNIELAALDGKRLDILPREHAATVFLFARTDCPISNRYAPTVRALVEEFSSRDVAFYMVYVNPKQSSDKIRAHQEAYRYPCSAVRDDTHRLVQQLGVRVTPEAVILDQSGRVAYRGRIDDRFVDFGKTRQAPTRNDLQLALQEVLAGRDVKVPTTKAIGCFIADLNR